MTAVKIRGYDLTGMIITSLKNAIINNATNLSHINVSADMSYIVDNYLWIYNNRLDDIS